MAARRTASPVTTPPPTPHRLSVTEARRIAVRAQLLDDDRPVDLLDTVRHLTLLQHDLTRAVAPSADLVAWSRLGFGYAPHHLVDALAAGSLVEFRGMIRPAEDLALHRADMLAWRAEDTAPQWGRTRVGWVQANADYRRDVLAKLTAEGPLTSRELPDTCAVSWRSSGWNHNRNAAMMLDTLELRGEVATTGARRGRDRLWDLASRIHPDDRVVPAAEALRTRRVRLLTALGIARSTGPRSPNDSADVADVADVGEPAVVEGLRGSWRVDPAQLDRPFAGRIALLSPLDRLVFDRARMADVFGFDYQLEMYKPKARRRFGYFALPVLDGEELIGKVDATADHRAGQFRVDAVHRDGVWDEGTAAAVDAEIAALAAWLDLPLAGPGVAARPAS